jgi:hypothetical protein
MDKFSTPDAAGASAQILSTSLQIVQGWSKSAAAVGDLSGIGTRAAAFVIATETEGTREEENGLRRREG